MNGEGRFLPRAEDIKMLVFCVGKGGKVATTFENGVFKVWVNEFIKYAPPHANLYELEDFLANVCLFIGSDEDRGQYFPGWVGNERFIIREPEIN